MMYCCLKYFILVLLLVTICHTQEDSTNEMQVKKRSKRYIVIFPNNSVMQFAMALVLPAQVKGRNIATNTGFLLNIPLPTNASQLRIPWRGRAADTYKQFRDSLLPHLASYTYFNFECLMTNLYMMMQAKAQDNYMLQILQLIFKEITVHLHFSGNETALDESMFRVDVDRFTSCPFKLNDMLDSVH